MCSELQSNLLIMLGESIESQFLVTAVSDLPRFADGFRVLNYLKTLPDGWMSSMRRVHRQQRRA